MIIFNIMLRFQYVPLVEGYAVSFPVKYQVIDSVREFDEKLRCIVVRHLSPDYYLLFSFIDLIITENGSRLSHLAILALEYNRPVFLCNNIISGIAPLGSLSIHGKTITVKT